MHYRKFSIVDICASIKLLGNSAEYTRDSILISLISQCC